MRSIRRGRCAFVAALCLIAAASARSHADEGDDRERLRDTTSIDGKHASLRLRFGMGGFREGRSPEGQLGGDQVALEIGPVKSPIAVMYSAEFYTNSPDPTNPYEIESLHALNVVYSHALFEFDEASYFVGGGFGRLKVPAGETAPGGRIGADLFNLEAGINVRIWRGLGLYGLLKYLHSEKTVNGVKVVDFDENIVLLGVTYRFSL